MRINNKITNDIKRYSYDDFRKNISDITKRNGKRIPITEILSECGISRGNYYAFMKGGTKLSYKKLQQLMKALVEADVFATNRMRLEAMSDEDLAAYIEKHLIGDPKAKQIDVLSWLKSQDEDIIYR